MSPIMVNRPAKRALIRKLAIGSLVLVSTTCGAPPTTPAAMVAEASSSSAASSIDWKVLKTQACGETTRVCKRVHMRGSTGLLRIRETPQSAKVYDAVEKESVTYRSQRLEVDLIAADGSEQRLFQAEMTQCNDDSAAQLVPGTTKITDLDSNQSEEVFVLYRLTCNSRFGPAELGLFLYRDGEAYTLQGQQFYLDADARALDEQHPFVIDDKFRNLSRDYLNFAMLLWTQALYDDTAGKMTPEKRRQLQAERSKLRQQIEAFWSSESR